MKLKNEKDIDELRKAIYKRILEEEESKDIPRKLELCGEMYHLRYKVEAIQPWLITLIDTDIRTIQDIVNQKKKDRIINCIFFLLFGIIFSILLLK